MIKKNIILNFLFARALIQKFPKVFDNVLINNDNLLLIINKKNMILAFLILKKHTFCQFNILMDITSVDYLNSINRFHLVYQLISTCFNFRLSIKIIINVYESIISLNNIYKSSGWLEREIWDLFGIFFSLHNDLRRILTDYGFNGFPLRKDFPLTGFLEVIYNNDLKRIVYKPLQLTQEFRFFDFQSPWYSVKL